MVGAGEKRTPLLFEKILSNGAEMFKFVFMFAFALWAGSVNAGWYKVTNYVGFVGDYPVHFSVQSMDGVNDFITALDGVGKLGDRIQYLGSYYYDRHRIPIPLYGRKDEKGGVRLCEVLDFEKFRREVLGSMKKDPVDVSNCQFRIFTKGNFASGEWSDGLKKYVVSLKRVGVLQNDGEKSRVEGVVEIPFWAKTRGHMLVGVYGYEESFREYAQMNKLLAINIKTGAVDEVVDVSSDHFGAGTLRIGIYENVENNTSNGREGVLVHGLDRFDYVVPYVFKSR